jgi:hypothetical protein
MLRNTATKFGELRQGDRFYFAGDKKKIVYQVTTERLVNKSSYNIVDAEGKALWPFDKQSAHDKPVIFLRHTIPAPGEECRLYDLQQGDVFFFPDDFITEYLILKTDGSNARERYEIHALHESSNRLWQADTAVFYVGKAELQA